MLYKVLTKISYFDRFGAEVKLNFRKKETHQSPFGGFCTILLVLVLTVIFIEGAIGLIKKETFTISSNKILNVDPPITQLLFNDFMIAFQAENLIGNGTKRLLNFIFTSNVQMMDENGNMTKTETSSHNLEQCTIQHFIEFDQSNTYNKLLKDQLSYYYCLPLNYSLQIQGTYKSNIFQYGKISVTICSTDDDCYSSAEIQQFQQQGYFNNSFKINTLMLNRVPNLNMESNYISYIYSDYYIQAKIGQEIKTDVFLEQQQLSIEKSVIPGIKSLEQDSVFSIMDNKLQASSVFTSNITKVASFFIRLSQSEIHYYKEYYRFDELFSYVGGITQFLATILGYFILRYNQTGLQIKLANALYQFDMPEKKKGEMEFSFETLVNKIFESLRSIEDVVSKFKNSAQRVITLTRLTGALKFTNQSVQQTDKIDQEIPNQIKLRLETQHENLKSEKCQYYHESNQTFYLEQDKKKFLTLIIQLILESRKKLSFGVHFIAKQVSGSLKKNSKVNYQSQLFEKSRNMILRDMDILVIMSKLQEIEKIKHVIFNKTQRKIFNYLQKPVVFVKDKINQCKFDQSLIQCDLQNKREDALRLTMSSKSLLGVRQKFNTEKKFKKLYEAYENLALSEDKDETEKLMNQRLLELVEPTIQYSFNSLVEIEKLSRQMRYNKKKRVATNILKPKTVKLGSSNDIEEDGEKNDDIDSFSLNCQKKDNLHKRSPQILNDNRFKNYNNMQNSKRLLKDVKLNQVQSKQDLIDIDILF